MTDLVFVDQPGSPVRVGFDPAQVVHGLADADPDRADRLTHLEVRAAREAKTAPWPDWVDPAVRGGLESVGISSLWSHQAAASDLAHRGHHVVVATGTASGKSVGYLLPALVSIVDSVGQSSARGDTVIYLAPTKALAHDQLATIASLGIAGVRPAAFDGDATSAEREWARAHANFLLTNPDMLHRTMLPRHQHWGPWLATLRYVVIDECHHYRGVFGAHVAQIVRRLRRIACSYGAEPTFVLASATTSDPSTTASRLVGAPVTAVETDGSPRGASVIALWEPPFTHRTGERGSPMRRPATAETADLVTDLVARDVRTLAFVRSRRAAESVALTVQRRLREVDADLSSRVAPYRGGFLPEERRIVEERLRRGDLMAVCATNALELGIDIQGLDAVVLAGYPGTRASMWQQLGRAGRGDDGGLGIIVARDDPLDTYLVTHPEMLLGVPVESTVFDPDNPFVLAPHLCAAAQELPLTDTDIELFGPSAGRVVGLLVRDGLLRRRSRGWFWTRRERAADLVDIRTSGGSPVRVVETDTGRVLGTVDAASSHTTVHTGAVYVHFGDSYLVDTFDPVDGVAQVTRADPDYSTSARDITSIDIRSTRRTVDWGQGRVSFGTVEVTSRTVAYQRRLLMTGEILGEEPLDLPERHLETRAVWWTMSRDQLVDSGVPTLDLPGAAHAAEHASIGLLPLFATCDRWDIGGVSTVHHRDTGTLTVFVYDGHPGGAGFAERGFESAAEWLRATRDAISSCACEAGCPSCVQSPKCGNGNHPLHKQAAVTLLTVLLSQPRGNRLP
jgi:DEAD/DEAH box helicase domain-containing protein